jgi:hypothetical protein
MRYRHGSCSVAGSVLVGSQTVVRGGTEVTGELHFLRYFILQLHLLGQRGISNKHNHRII